MSPIIGVTCKTETAIEDYKNAVVEFGGEPRVLVSRPGRTPEGLPEIDGLLLPGGGDLDPRHYDEPRSHVNGISKIRGVSQSRDALELHLCQKALESDIPVFGICRGIQVMNVVMGAASTKISTHNSKNACFIRMKKVTGMLSILLRFNRVAASVN